MEAMYQVVFVERWPFWAGGAAIGCFLLAFLRYGGQMLGVSSGFNDLCAAPFDPACRASWKLPFLFGLVAGGLVAGVLAGVGAGGFRPSFEVALFDTLTALPFGLKAAVFAVGGVLIGFGTRMANGCTSGHGIAGMALLAPASIIATVTFMVAGFVTTQLFFMLYGA